MNAKSLHTLEFDKIVQRVAERTSFSAGDSLRCRACRPTTSRWPGTGRPETGEARLLLSEHSDVHLGGVFDVRV